VADKPAGEIAPKLQKPSVTAINSELLRGVRVSLEARLGRAEMTVENIMGLKSGSIVELETEILDDVNLYLNNTLVARGEIVAVGNKFGVRITDIAVP
jgi:flagellar motor switch protein FliN/FliY